MHPRTLVAAAFLFVVTSALSAASRDLDIETARSAIGFRVKATGHSFPGTVGSWTLHVSVPEGADVPESAVFTAQVGSLSTKHEARDGDMMRWIESTVFPDLSYELGTLTRTDAGYNAEGVLKLHGVSMPITFPVTITRTGDLMTIHGEAVVDHRQFNLPVIKKFAFLTVNPEIAVVFDITGTLK